MEIITKSAEETKNFGGQLGASLKGGEIIALSGELGSGKTTFIQGLAASLGLDRITSPTFILMRSYPIKLGNLYHLDLYRLEDDVMSETRNLGVMDIWGKKENIVVIEWAEKLVSALPKETKWIKFSHMGTETRKIEYEAIN